MGRRRGGSAQDTGAAEPWGTGRLAALFLGGLLVAALVLGGVVYAAVQTLTGGDAGGEHIAAGSAVPTTGAGTGTAPTAGLYGYDEAKADALADRPMQSVTLEDAQPSVLSTTPPGTIQLPIATTLGPAGVPTGFPQTPEGALAQVAAIGKTAMETLSISGVRDVIAAWAVPGGPTPDTYSGTHSMADLLSSAGLSSDGNGQMSLRVTPIMGLIKGTVGTTFVVACVDHEFVATVQSTARVGVADCQRMVWTDGRWMIGPGPEPAPGPSVWPGTALSIEVGYKDIRYV